MEDANPHPLTLGPVSNAIARLIGLDTRTRARAASVCKAWVQSMRDVWPPRVRLGDSPVPGPPAVPTYSHPNTGALSPDRVHAAVAFNMGQLVVFNVGTGEPIHLPGAFSFFPYVSIADSLVFSRDGTLLMLSGYANTHSGAFIHVYRVSDATLHLSSTFIIHTPNVEGDVRCDFGSVASDLLAVNRATGHNGITLRSASTGRSVRVINTGPHIMDHIRFSPDGSLLAAVPDYTGGNDEHNLVVYIPATGLARGSFDLPKANDLVWSPDGTRIATVSNRCLQVWHVASFTLHFILPQCPGDSVDWSADGRLLLSVCNWRSYLTNPPYGHEDAKQTHVRIHDATTGLLRSMTIRDGHSGPAVFVSTGPQRHVMLFAPESPHALAHAWALDV